ncbi:MAG TPA: carbon starvation CstA 5TM domain-containing protein, partial [Planctomycetota bacterium]|nr:carbon starvation CstA 5TM domain-containing protein [Planctomycetota bacterium]
VPLKNRYIATVIAVLPGIALAFWTVEDPVTGVMREAAWVLWPIFGASNQMLAALTLLTLSLYFWRKNKPVWPLTVPMVFLFAITLTSLLAKTMEFWGQKNWLLVVISTLLTTLVLWMLVEAASVLARARRTKPGASGP